MKKYKVLVFDETRTLVQTIYVEEKGKRSACMKAIHELDRSIKGDISMRAERIYE